MEEGKGGGGTSSGETCGARAMCYRRVAQGSVLMVFFDKRQSVIYSGGTGRHFVSFISE